jgi:hypothetical protein
MSRSERQKRMMARRQQEIPAHPSASPLAYLEEARLKFRARQMRSKAKEAEKKHMVGNNPKANQEVPTRRGHHCKEVIS